MCFKVQTVLLSHFSDEVIKASVKFITSQTARDHDSNSHCLTPEPMRPGLGCTKVFLGKLGGRRMEVTRTLLTRTLRADSSEKGHSPEKVLGPSQRLVTMRLKFTDM